MDSKRFKEDFLRRTRTTTEQRDKYSGDWESLRLIHDDYVKDRNQLENVGEAYSKLVQRIPGVHSVRWRSKDPIALIDKIIRKISADPSIETKYSNISVENYKKIVTDLVGIRALYLFKSDIDKIHEALKSKLELHESEVIFYHREGDFVENGEEEKRKKQGFTPKIHHDSYRSIHYICQGGIDRSFPVIFELQVRSLNDEAWSEVDHKIRYPNFDDNPLILQLLQILNRLSGSADEMSNFVKTLSSSLQESNLQSQQREKEYRETVSELRNEISKINRNNSKEGQKNTNQVDALLNRLLEENSEAITRMHHQTLLGGLLHIAPGPNKK